MPRITLPLTTSYENITRPVAMSIARDVMRICNISQDTPLYIPGEFDQVNQPGTAMGQSDEIRWQSDSRIYGTVTDIIKNDAVMQAVVRQNEQPPFLEDRQLGVSLRPVYIPSDLTIAFRHTFSTRQEAIRWRDEMAVRRAENRTSMSHEIQYDIPIGDGILSTLSHLHELRENVAGYGQDFTSWFRSMRRAMFVMLGTVDGREDTLTMMVRQKQVHITGYFDFSDIPQEQKVDGNSTWEIQFSYHLQYDRCTHLYFAYPLVVHQQHIDEAFYDATPRFGVEEVNKNGSIGITALDHMNEYVNSYPPPMGGLRVPYYDEWIPPKTQQPIYTVPLVSWMIVLDPDDPQNILDLTDLPDMQWAVQVDTLFRAFPSKLTVRGQSPVIFTLFCDDVAMDQSVLKIDKSLHVRATRPLDLRKTYHLRMSFVCNYSLLVPSTIDDMKRNAEATLLLFQTVWPTLDVEDAHQRLLDGQYLTTNYIVWFYQLIMDHGIGMFNQGGHIHEGPGGTDQRWKGGVGSNSKNPAAKGPKNPSLYTGSNWRVNMSEGGYSNPDGSGGTGTDGPWGNGNAGGGGSGGTGSGSGNGNNGGNGNGGGNGGYDINDPTWRNRANGGPHYVQFLSIFTMR